MILVIYTQKETAPPKWKGCIDKVGVYRDYRELCSVHPEGIPSPLSAV